MFWVWETYIFWRNFQVTMCLLHVPSQWKTKPKNFQVVFILMEMKNILICHVNNIMIITNACNMAYWSRFLMAIAVLYCMRNTLKITFCYSGWTWYWWRTWTTRTSRSKGDHCFISLWKRQWVKHRWMTRMTIFINFEIMIIIIISCFFLISLCMRPS